MDGSRSINHLVDTSLGYGEVVDTLRTYGLTTAADSPGDGSVACSVFDDPGSRDLEYIDDVDLETAIDRIDEAHYGAMDFWFDGESDWSVSVSLSGETPLDQQIIGVSFDKRTIDPSMARLSSADVQNRLSQLVGLAKIVAERMEPAFTFTYEVTELATNLESREPSGRPISEHVEELGWLTILSPAVIEEVGGREHVLDAPAWKIEELETGHVLLLASDRPAEHPFSAGTSPTASLSEYLLE